MLWWKKLVIWGKDVLGAAGEKCGQGMGGVKKEGWQQRELGTAWPCCVSGDGKYQCSGAVQTYCRRGWETEAEARVEVGPVGADLDEPRVGAPRGRWLRNGINTKDHV